MVEAGEKQVLPFAQDGIVVQDQDCAVDDVAGRAMVKGCG